jgi:hypothetical protein
MVLIPEITSAAFSNQQLEALKVLILAKLKLSMPLLSSLS